MDFAGGGNTGIPTIAPVIHLKSNKTGVFDPGGDVRDWRENLYSDDHERRVVRGVAGITTFMPIRSRPSVAAMHPGIATTGVGRAPHPWGAFGTA